MNGKLSYANYYFWLLIAVAFFLIGSLLKISWDHGPLWVRTVWQVCQSGLAHLKEQLPTAWWLIIPVIALLIIIRGGISMLQQVRATQRLVRLFFPLRETPPARLQDLLVAYGLLLDDVVFLNLSVPHALCLGFWRPRIWLTAGLVELLTDEELAAVLGHEWNHCQQRDPLRLLIGRALQAAFFFLPLVGQLAQASELQQEVAADQVAIRQAGNDLPLLSALRKLLSQESADIFPEAAYSPFNVTEARLRRLIYAAHPCHRRTLLPGLMVSLEVIAIVSGSLVFSARPSVAQTEIKHCVAESAVAAQTSSLFTLNHPMPR